MPESIRHLYFHIPFCPKLCPYCSFYVETGAKNKNTAFVEALLADVRRACDEYDIRPRTIYFGGGTPSALLEEQLDMLLGGLRKLIDFSDVEELSLERTRIRNESLVPEGARRGNPSPRLFLAISFPQGEPPRSPNRARLSPEQEKCGYSPRSNGAYTL